MKYIMVLMAVFFVGCTEVEDCDKQIAELFDGSRVGYLDIGNRYPAIYLVFDDEMTIKKVVKCAYGNSNNVIYVGKVRSLDTNSILGKKRENRNHQEVESTDPMTEEEIRNLFEPTFNVSF